ncbi:cubilin-like [Dendronephthya gigantea]|uniref:cubilin-like n=1 Tax=Dendronephthya gigantea TaxID=151771 RepID=UPI001069262C|nr:cubilin-like [Dendronephthya gigantea]
MLILSVLLKPIKFQPQLIGFKKYLNVKRLNDGNKSYGDFEYGVDYPVECHVECDIDECAEGDPCGFNTNCTNTNGSYTCECLFGFEGNGTNCTDINECERDAPCHTNATCTNVDGSYYCACKANFSGDGFFCEVLTCKVEAIYYATTDAIKGVFSDGNTTVTILSATNVKLNYDSGTKRLLYYDGTSLITVKLDGRNITKLSPTDIANVVDLDSDPDNSSLVFADANKGDIVRYFLDKDTNEVVYHNDTSPKYLTVDPQYEVIYWIDYIVPSDSYSLMKTYFNGSTSEVKFYPGTTSSVNVAIGKDNFYVMDSTRKRIDVFDRPNATFQYSFFLSDSPQEITVVEDLDECCIGGYCHDNATCTNTPGSYFCTCKEGYTGIGTNCEEINACQTNPCDVNANCTNIDGSYNCTCHMGYEGNGYNYINECQTNPCGVNANCTNTDKINACQTNPCDVNANCTNIDGSYNCTCHMGYEEINACQTNPCDVNANCTNIDGSYNCTCHMGYEEINACQTNPCDVNANCTNIDGSYNCTCHMGYEEINACQTNPCDVNANCTNIDGSYNCTCHMGYEGNGYNYINECQTNPCGVNANCTNTDKINACQTNPCDVNANCTNIDVSYNCTCHMGYEEINACQTNPCDVNANCTNIDGSYNCTCHMGYEGSGYNCTDINECETNPCGVNADCTNTDEFFGGKSIEKDYYTDYRNQTEDNSCQRYL